MIERTLVLVKPDGVIRALTGRIIARFEDAGLKPVAIKMVKPSRELAGRHYIDDPKWLEETGAKAIAAYKEKGVEVKDTPVQAAMRIRGYLMDFISSGPVVAMALEGNDAIAVTRKITGATEPKRADPSTIRGYFSTDSYGMADSKNRPLKNLVHASEDKATADREISIWFTAEELVDYKSAAEAALY